MGRTYRTRRGAVAAATSLAAAAVVFAAPAMAASIDVTVLSSRPDQVSGGDALVRVDAPRGLLDKLAVLRNGEDVTAAFTRDGDGLQGLVEGLRDGENTLTVRVRARQRPRPGQGSSAPAGSPRPTPAEPQKGAEMHLITTVTEGRTTDDTFAQLLGRLPPAPPGHPLRGRHRRRPPGPAEPRQRPRTPTAPPSSTGRLQVPALPLRAPRLAGSRDLGIDMCWIHDEELDQGPDHLAARVQDARHRWKDRAEHAARAAGSSSCSTAPAWPTPPRARAGRAVPAPVEPLPRRARPHRARRHLHRGRPLRATRRSAHRVQGPGATSSTPPATPR